MLEKVEGKITNGQSTGNRTKTKTKQNKTNINAQHRKLK